MMRFVKCVIEAMAIFHAHFGVLIPSRDDFKDSSKA